MEDRVKGENVRQDHTFQGASASWTHVLAPTITNEFRTSFRHRNMSVAFLRLPPDRPPIIRWTATSSSNIMGDASQYPVVRVGTIYQYINNISMHSAPATTPEARDRHPPHPVERPGQNYDTDYYQFLSATA